MKSAMKLIKIAALLAGFSMAGCGNLQSGSNGSGGADDGFVPVTNITGVNTSVTVGTVPLGGRVVPPDATNKTIRWSVLPDGDTEGTISGNKLTTEWPGLVVVMATVVDGKAVGENYTKKFNISVDPYVPVTSIVFRGSMNIEVGDVDLEAVVYPYNASYTDIVWSVKDAGTTGARIKDDTLITWATGTLWVTATIKNGIADGMDFTTNFFFIVSDSTPFPPPSP